MSIHSSQLCVQALDTVGDFPRVISEGDFHVCACLPNIAMSLESRASWIGTPTHEAFCYRLPLDFCCFGRRFPQFRSGIFMFPHQNMLRKFAHIRRLYIFSCFLVLHSILLGVRCSLSPVGGKPSFSVVSPIYFIIVPSFMCFRVCCCVCVYNFNYVFALAVYYFIVSHWYL